MAEPQIHINWIAIAIAMLAAFFFGFVWYGPLFGKIWGTLMGMKMDQKPDVRVMRRALMLQILGLLLTSYVLAHTIHVWRPSVWSVGDDHSLATYGFFGGFFTWIGFYVPLQLSKVSWENRPWKLFFINSGHDFLNLQIISQIIAHWP